MAKKKKKKKTVARDLKALAGAYGIQTSYVDAFGTRRHPSTETLLRVLGALGAPVREEGDLKAALRERKRAAWQQVVEPVIVVWDGKGGDIHLRLPEVWAAGRFELRLFPEWGAMHSRSGEIEELAVADSAEVDGVRYVIRRLPLPGMLPLGYHRATVELGGASYEVLVVSAPRKAYTPEADDRLWGVFLPLYALHSARSPGAGDLADLEALMNAVRARGASVVATLPLLSAFLDDPCEPSPYLPVSRRYWNELYVNFYSVPELADSEPARRRLESADFQSTWQLLRADPFVDHRQQMALKRSVLAELSHTLFAGTGRRREAFERFVDRHPSLEDYARFRAVHEKLRTPWSTWPSPLREGDLTHTDFEQNTLRYHAYVQWLLHEQLGTLSAHAREEGPGLVLDMPLGMHPDGYDVWREQSLFLGDVAVGSPPDPFFTRGQNWGFPPLHPFEIRCQRYRYLIECLRTHLRYASALRIDHVMALHRLYVIPSGMEAAAGTYVRFPEDEMYAVLCLESHRHRSRIIGEDLGTVPASIRRTMKGHGIQRTWVAQFELDPDSDEGMAEPPRCAVASLNTHDMPTFAAYWNGTDIEDRLALGLLDDGEVGPVFESRQVARDLLVSSLHEAGRLAAGTDDLVLIVRALLEQLAASRADVVLVNLEDTWLETAPQNVPGTVDERPNWRRKARHSLEEMLSLPEVRAALEMVAAQRDG